LFERGRTFQWNRAAFGDVFAIRLRFHAALAACRRASLFCRQRGRSSVVEHQLPKLFPVTLPSNKSAFFLDLPCSDPQNKP
jgi:hypothetical protein